MFCFFLIFFYFILVLFYLIMKLYIYYNSIKFIELIFILIIIKYIFIDTQYDRLNMELILRCLLLLYTNDYIICLIVSILKGR